MNKRMIGAALALSLLGGTSALAQHDDHDRGGAGGEPRHHGDSHGEGRPQSGGPAGPHAPAGPTPGAQPRALQSAPIAGVQGGGDRHRTPVGPEGGVGERRGFTGGPDVRAGDQRLDRRDHGVQGDQRFQGGDSRWRDGDRRDGRFNGGDRDRPRYDRREFPSVIHSDRRYHWRGPAWYGPPGFYYRHWGYGDHLPWGWFSSRWYIEDYYDYDLPLPPYGYEWVRLGPDALLVDIRTGVVVETEYGLFW